MVSQLAVKLGELVRSRRGYPTPRKGAVCLPVCIFYHSHVFHLVSSSITIRRFAPSALGSCTEGELVRLAMKEEYYTTLFMSFMGK